MSASETKHKPELSSTMLATLKKGGLYTQHASDATTKSNAETTSSVVFVFYKNRKDTTGDSGALYYMKTGSTKANKLSLSEIAAINKGAIHPAFASRQQQRGGEEGVGDGLLLSLHSKQGVANDLCLEAKDTGMLEQFVHGVTTLLEYYGLDYEGNANPNLQAKQEKKKSREETVMLCGQALCSVKRDMQHLRTDCKALMEFVNMDLSPMLEGVALRVHALNDRLLKESRKRKKLLNQVIELKGNIRVYVRVRPFLKHERTASSSSSDLKSILAFPDESDDQTKILISDPQAMESRKHNAISETKLTFDRVYNPSASQTVVFEDVEPFVSSCLDGYNVCVFAYGQTGSGKTFSMEGTSSDPGINYRCLHELFLNLQQKQTTTKATYQVTMSVVEVYNEKVRDLLVQPSSNNNKHGSKVSTDLQVKTDSEGKMYIPGLHVEHVNNTEEVRMLMTNVASANRQVCSTAMNDRSSRSHSLVFVHVLSDDPNHKQGKLVLVDLAGSERVKKSEVTGDALREATYINKSLSALGDVISSLRLNKAHVPYRNSKLTYLLQDCLSGHSKCLMFCQVSPHPECYNESLSSLKFAARVRSTVLSSSSSSSSNNNNNNNNNRNNNINNNSNKENESVSAPCLSENHQQQQQQQQATPLKLLSSSSSRKHSLKG